MRPRLNDHSREKPSPAPSIVGVCYHVSCLPLPESCPSCPLSPIQHGAVWKVPMTLVWDPPTLSRAALRAEGWPVRCEFSKHAEKAGNSRRPWARGSSFWPDCSSYPQCNSWFYKTSSPPAKWESNFSPFLFPPYLLCHQNNLRQRVLT